MTAQHEPMASGARAVRGPAAARALAERADLVNFLESLSPRDWNTPSLCEGWTVRDVAAHLVSYDASHPAEIARRLWRARLSPGALNAHGVAEYRSKEPAELVALLRSAHGLRGLPRSIGGSVVLTDTLIHHQDIRRPLRLPRPVPPDRLVVALRFATFAPPLRGFWRARGVRLVATDVDWSFGAGPAAYGRGEALLMVLAGRRSVIPELDGPGVATLVDRRQRHDGRSDGA